MTKSASMLSAIVESITKDLFSPEMDFITKMLVVILMFSLFVEALWIISPRKLKGYIVRFDRQSLLHSSKSASVAFSMGTWCLITKLNESTDSWTHKSRTSKTLFKSG